MADSPHYGINFNKRLGGKGFIPYLCFKQKIMEMNNISNINYEDYIGREVIGFKFEDSDELHYSPDMNKYIGRVGHISEYYERTGVFEVQFDDDWWNYPADLVIKQLEQKEALIEMMEKDEESGIYGDDSEVFNPQAHYDNSKGSLYKIAEELRLNHWEFDIFKRLVRCRKKGQFKEDLQKIKDTIDIYLSEFKI